MYSYPFEAMVNLCTKMAPSDLEIPKENETNSRPVGTVQEGRDILLMTMNSSQRQNPVPFAEIAACRIEELVCSGDQDYLREVDLCRSPQQE